MSRKDFYTAINLIAKAITPWHTKPLERDSLASFAKLQMESLVFLWQRILKFLLNKGWGEGENQVGLFSHFCAETDDTLWLLLPSRWGDTSRPFTACLCRVAEEAVLSWAPCGSPAAACGLSLLFTPSTTRKLGPAGLCPPTWVSVSDHFLWPPELALPKCDRLEVLEG